MPRIVFSMLVVLACVGHAGAQQVFVARDEGSATAPVAAKKEAVAATPLKPVKVAPADAQPPVGATIVKTQPISAKPGAAAKPKPDATPGLVMIARAPTTGSAASSAVKSAASPAKVQSAAVKSQPAPAVAATALNPKPVRPTGVMPAAQTMRLTKVEGPAPEPHEELPAGSADMTSRFLKAPLETAFVKLADGFDFPVGKPESQGYYKARGFRSHGHMGEDWDGIRGGDTDLGDPIYCIGDGIVVFARDCHMGWGNVIIVRHSYREGGMVRNVDSLYGHCDKIMVHRGQVISRGQQIATMGTAHGLYDAHLHLEVRKNIEIGMSRAKFAQDSSNYYDPTQFINAHRHLQGGGASYRVAMNTFTHDSRINWAAVRNYSHSHHHGGTRESSTALKKAVAKGG
ncbi:MAG: peptidoglycan DD-metalloendopeptidase family protein [Chthoniobacterales bacterium]